MRKNHTIWYVIIPCPKMVFSYPWVCHHTNNCHFIPYRYVIIPNHVILYRKGINSYLYMSLYTSVASYQNMSFHTCDSLIHT